MQTKSCGGQLYHEVCVRTLRSGVRTRFGLSFFFFFWLYIRIILANYVCPTPSVYAWVLGAKHVWMCWRCLFPPWDHTTLTLATSLRPDPCGITVGLTANLACRGRRVTGPGDGWAGANGFVRDPAASPVRWDIFTSCVAPALNRKSLQLLVSAPLRIFAHFVRVVAHVLRVIAQWHAQIRACSSMRIYAHICANMRMNMRMYMRKYAHFCACAYLTPSVPRMWLQPAASY